MFFRLYFVMQLQFEGICFQKMDLFSWENNFKTQDSATLLHKLSNLKFKLDFKLAVSVLLSLNVIRKLNSLQFCRRNSNKVITSINSVNQYNYVQFQAILHQIFLEN